MQLDRRESGRVPSCSPSLPSRFTATISLAISARAHTRSQNCAAPRNPYRSPVPVTIALHLGLFESANCAPRRRNLAVMVLPGKPATASETCPWPSLFPPGFNSYPTADKPIANFPSPFESSNHATNALLCFLPRRNGSRHGLKLGQLFLCAL